MEYQPLISVIVLTYNSSPFVLETLESVKEQTYGNIELIITDDGSRDDTVGLCRNWLNANKDFFVSGKLLESKDNKGLVQNCNNGLEVSGGDWIKLIAGDDILMDICIEDNVRYISKHKDACVVFSGMLKIDDNSDPVGDYPFPAGFFAGNTRLKLVKLLHYCCLQAPSAFFNSAILREVGGFDPAYPMMEDFPMWVKLLTLNYDFGFFEKRTVCYRVHGGSISGGRKLNPLYVRSCMDFNRDIRLPLAKKLSPALYRILKVDVAIFYVEQHYPVIIKLVYPLLWVWARYRSSFNPLSEGMEADLKFIKE